MNCCWSEFGQSCGEPFHQGEGFSPDVLPYLTLGSIPWFLPWQHHMFTAPESGCQTSQDAWQDLLTVVGSESFTIPEATYDPDRELSFLQLNFWYHLQDKTTLTGQKAASNQSTLLVSWGASWWLESRGWPLSHRGGISAMVPSSPTQRPGARPDLLAEMGEVQNLQEYSIQLS